jgi:hypothetical protein
MYCSASLSDSVCVQPRNFRLVQYILYGLIIAQQHELQPMLCYLNVMIYFVILTIFSTFF